MDVDLIFKIAAIGILVAVLNLILVRSGRDEQALLTTLAGLIVVLMMIVYEIAELFDTTTDYLTGKTDDPDPHTGKDNDTLTWEDLGMPYKGKIPEELKATYADIAKGYFKRHPEMLNKNNK